MNFIEPVSASQIGWQIPVIRKCLFLAQSRYRRQSGNPVRQTDFLKADINFHISAVLVTGLIAAFADTSDYPLLGIPRMAWRLIWPS